MTLYADKQRTRSEDRNYTLNTDGKCLVTVFCPGFQKGRVPSEKGTFSAVNGPSKGHH